MPRGSVYTPEQLETMIQRVNQFKKENPDATRASLARYAGCDISVLKRLEKQGRLTLPKPLTHKQRRKRNKIDWVKTLGNIRQW